MPLTTWYRSKIDHHQAPVLRHYIHINMTDTGSNHVFQDILIEIKTVPQNDITFDRILNSLGAHSFDLAVLIFALPMVIPMPPGIPMTAGFIIAVSALQALFGKKHIWIPASMARKSIRKSSLIKAIHKTDHRLRFLFKYMSPRYSRLLSGPFEAFTYIIIFILGFAMILPIPVVGNSLPAFACVVLVLGRLQKDGLIVGIGLLLTLVILAINIFVGIETWKFIEFLFSQ